MRLFRLNNFPAAHVGNQHLGQHKAAVLLLAVFKDGGNGAARGQAGAVERVQERGLAALGLEADIGPAGLKVRAIGAGRNFAEGFLRGQPHFHIIGLGGAEAHAYSRGYCQGGGAAESAAER